MKNCVLLVIASLNFLPLFELVLSADLYPFLDVEQKYYDRNVSALFALLIL